MKNIVNVFHQFLFQHLFIGICAFAMTLATKYYYNIFKVDVIDYFVLFATIWMYNFHKLYVSSHDKIAANIVKSFFEKDVWSRFFILIPAVITLFLFFFLPFKIQITVAVLAFICFAYSMPLLEKRLREIWGVKIILIALVWAISTAFFPVFAIHQNVLSAKAILIFMHHFLFVAALTIPFEIRDMEKEKIQGIVLLPQILGIKKIKIMAVGMVILLMIIGYYLEQYLFSNVIICIYTFFLILFTHDKRHSWYFKFLIDGAMLLYFILIFLEKYYK